MPIELGMSAMELSSHLLEMPKDVYRLHSQMLIGCSLLNQENCKLIGWCWQITLHIDITLTYILNLFIFSGIQDIPEQLPGILHKLERLDLSCNSLNESSFPPSFKSLTTLIEINLNSNLLTSLPPMFTALHRLQRLYLGEKAIVSTASPSLFNHLAVWSVS